MIRSLRPRADRKDMRFRGRDELPGSEGNDGMWRARSRPDDLIREEVLIDKRVSSGESWPSGAAVGFSVGTGVMS